MNDNFDNIFEDDETSILIDKYEKMLDKNTEYFFDIIEFEDIIDHYIYGKKTDEALQVIEYANRQHPYEVNFSVKKAIVFIEQKKPKKALKTLELVESFVDDDIDFFFIKGEAFVSMGEPQKASEIFYKLFETFAEDDYAENAIDIFQIFDKYNEQLYAIKFLKLAFDIEPESIPILHFIAYSYEHIGQYKKAVNSYKNFLNKYPFSDNAWFNLGIVYYNHNDFEESIKALEFSIAINPTSTIAYFHLANAYYAVELYKKAIIYYNEFLLVEEEDPIVEYYLGQCYNALENIEEALKHYEKCIEGDEFYAYAYFEKANIYVKDHNNEKALNNINKAIEIEPDNDEFYNLKGTISLNINKLEDAILLFKKSIDINPSEIEYLTNLTDTYIKLEKYNEAIEILEKQTKNINNSIIYYRLSAYYLLVKKNSEAIINFEKGLKLNYYNYLQLLYLYPKTLKNKTIIKLLKKYK